MARQISSSARKYTGKVDAATIGVVGAIMLALINRLTTDDDWSREPLTLAVPLASAFLANALRWVMDVLSPESAEVYQIRRCLKKQIKQVEKALASEHISEEYRCELKQKHEKYSAALIDAHGYMPPK